MLGELSVTQGSEVASHFRTQKTAALLAYLAFHTGVPQPRELLIERFWPDADLDQGRASLRTALSSLRKPLGDSLTADTTTAMLTVETDLACFESAIRAARSERLSEQERIQQLSKAVEIYGGPLLPGLYDDWVLAERDRLTNAYVAALAALARWYTGVGELLTGLDYAHRAAIADPLNEEVRADLIRLLRKANRPTEAKRQLKEFERLLEEQLSERPSATTLALVEGLSESEEAPEPERQVRLPQTLGRFRGRRDALNALTQRISGGKGDSEGTRLFTLFGQGGAGKTRLAIEVGRRLAAHHFFSGVYFAALADAYEEIQLWSGLHEGIGLVASPQISIRDQVIAHLRAAQPVLLLCDNLEQALPAASAVIESLLIAIPELTILATSRQRLAIPGEELIAVAGLPESDAIALFTDRARSVSPDFNVDSSNEASVRMLCQLVEGSPLALELAAAWAGTLTPAEMCTQLEASALDLPERKGGPERHRSLNAAIAWSLTLLEPELRQSFYSLSIFYGSFDAEAAQSICGITRHILASLRDRSLLRSEAIEGGMRFSLHESLRAYGQSELSPSEQSDLIAQHAKYFQSWAVEARKGLNSSEENLWNRKLRENWSNLHAAVEAQLTTLNDPNATLDFCSSLNESIQARTLWRQGLDWLTRALSAEVTTERRFSALLHAVQFANSLGEREQGMGFLAEAEELLPLIRTPKARAFYFMVRAYALGSRRGEFDLALTLLTEAVALCRSIDDQEGLVLTLLQCGDCQTKLGNLDAAETALREAETVANNNSWRSKRADVQVLLGLILCEKGKPNEAEPVFRAALAEFEQLGIELEVAHQHMNLGRVAYQNNNPAEARACLERAQTLYVRFGDQTHAMFALHNLGVVAHQMGDFEGQKRYQRESLQKAVDYQNRLAVIAGLENLGANYHALGDGLRGAQLCGAAARLRQEHSLPHAPAMQEQQDGVHARIQESMGADAFAEAFAQGQALTQEQAIALALTDS